MLNLLAIVTGSVVGKDPTNYYFDNKAEGLIYALIGFLVVFVGIILLIWIVQLIGLLMKKTNNLAFLTKKKERKAKKEKSNDKPSEAPVEQVPEEIPDEVKAAIMAAIMAYYEQEKPKSSFVVKRIKKL